MPAAYILPRKPPFERPSPTSLPKKRSEEDALSASRILVIDDDAGIRAYLRRCLAPLTTDVHEAADGIEALAVARALVPEGLALIIADVTMPRMNGREFYAALRTDPLFARVPVLFISGETGPVPEGTLLQKPFNAGAVRAAVHRVLTAA